MAIFREFKLGMRVCFAYEKLVIVAYDVESNEFVLRCDDDPNREVTFPAGSATFNIFPKMDYLVPSMEVRYTADHEVWHTAIRNSNGETVKYRYEIPDDFQETGEFRMVPLTKGNRILKRFAKKLPTTDQEGDKYVGRKYVGEYFEGQIDALFTRNSNGNVRYHTRSTLHRAWARMTVRNGGIWYCRLFHLKKLKYEEI